MQRNRTVPQQFWHGYSPKGRLRRLVNRLQKFQNRSIRRPALASVRESSTWPHPPFRELKELQDIHGELLALAEHFHRRREPLLLEWQRTVKRDPDLTDGDALPRAELFDHLPALLAAFERCLRHAAVEKAAEEAAQAPAAAHGLQRWLQGYDLREVTRELGKLNGCVILELDRFASANPNFSLDALARARQLWADLCSAGIEESVNQYFTLQQQEAAGHLKDLEQALEQIRELEQQRGDLWQQAAHDLRGNLSVVANVTVGLTRHGSQDSSREDFVRILMRNVTSLHQLLDDVTSLARLQAGRETRQIEPLDASLIVQSLCEGIRPIAAERGLFLKFEGPPGFAADGDAVKIRRIGQNLLLNAVKYTRVGGITVSWGDSAPDDPKRWVLCIQDTGPGFHTASRQPLAAALDTQRAPVPSSSATPDGAGQQGPALVKGVFSVDAIAAQSLRGDSGEGVGLSIVKRLCEMLDATIEMHSVPQVGTTFRILFPRHYN
jgi:signal transduction histidine kinase